MNWLLLSARGQCASVMYRNGVKRVMSSQSPNREMLPQENYYERHCLIDILKTKRQRKEKMKDKKESGTVKRNKFSLKTFSPDSKGPHSILLTATDGSKYFINLSNSLFRYQIGIRKRIPDFHNLLFTKFHVEDAASSLARIFSNVCFKENKPEILNIFGPAGITESVRKLASGLISKIYLSGLSNLSFFELHQRDILEFEKGPIKIKMIPVESCLEPTEHLSDTSIDTTTAYVFQCAFDTNLGSLQTDAGKKMLFLEHSYTDFENVESYMEYVSEKLASLDIIDSSDASIASIAVLECPTTGHFQDLSKKFASNFKNETFSLMVHIVPNAIYNTCSYRDWISRFGAHCEHIVLNEDSRSNCSTDVLYKPDIYRGIFHLVNPKLFPLYSNQYILNYLQNILDSSSASEQILDRYAFSINTSKMFKKTVEDSRLFCKKYLALLIDANLCNTPSSSMKHNHVYPRLVVLGSGDVTINLHRASPCYLLWIDESTSIMLDCSDNALSQLFKHYGNKLALEALSTIKAVILTHRHSDHWTGFMELLDAIVSVRNDRRKPVRQNQKKLNVFLTNKLNSYIGNFMKDARKGNLHHHARLHALEKVNERSSRKRLETVAKDLHLTAISFAKVNHGVSTFGVILKTKRGEKIVYSSDTLPMCRNLIKEGKDADLLIHDCLRVNDNEKLIADHKLHSTMRGAIATANKMNAKHVMLTHFSASCPLLPVPSLNIDEVYDGQVMYSLDHLEVSLNQLNDFPALHESLLSIYGSKSADRYQKQQRRFSSVTDDLRDSISMLKSVS